MPEIKPPPGQTTVQLPVLRSVVSNSRVLLQVVGAMTVPIGDTQGMYVGPNGYTEDPGQAQDFAPTISEEQVIVESPGAPGKSAYQLWLDEGNQGSYADYKASNRGEPGVAGQQGPQGDPGVKGDTGDQGPQGLRGEKGEQGDRGLPGAKGDAGPTGATGAAGSTGPMGQAGQQGLKGEPGQTGAQGPQGFTGAKGDQGLKGDTGSTGQTGATGAVGPKGDKGDTGSVGPSPKVSLGQVTVTQTAGIALSAGIRSVTLTVPGVLKDDDILLFPTAAMPAGYAIHNVVATAANTIVVTFFAPLLAIGASFTIACRVVALR